MAMVDNKDMDRSIAKYTLHSIVSRGKHRLWLMIQKWYFRLIMIIIWNRYLLTISKRELNNLKTHSHTYCIKDDWENGFNLRDTLDRRYRMSIFTFNAFRYVRTVMIMARQYNVPTKECNFRAIIQPIICTYPRLHGSNGNKNPIIPKSAWSNWKHYGTITSNTQP